MSNDELTEYEEWLKNLTKEELENIEKMYAEQGRFKEITEEQVLDINTILDLEEDLLKIFGDMYFMHTKSRELMQLKDCELSDIMHGIELGKPKNAIDGYMVYKELSRITKERRACKETLDRLDFLWKIFNQSNAENKMRYLINRIEKQLKSNNRDKEYTVKTEFGKEFIGSDKIMNNDWKKGRKIW